MNRIESMLLELKDTSEYMIDLAYSSLLYNNTDLAEEVEFLERKMDDLSDDIQEAIVNLGKQQPEEIARFSVILRLQMAIEDIANAAASIADVVLRGLGNHPVIQMSIQEPEVFRVRAPVMSRGTVTAMPSENAMGKPSRASKKNSTNIQMTRSAIIAHRLLPVPDRGDA